MADHNDDGFDEAYANSWFELSKSDFARVIFCDLSPYDEKIGVGCRFQITDNVHEDPCDYVGLYRVGWKNISQFIVLKLLTQIECEEDGKMLRCIFKGDEMPKLKDGFYQFLYVTRDNEVCGASTPFEVDRSPKDESSDEDVVADKTEDDFLVVRSNLFEKNRCFEEKITELQNKNEALKLEKNQLISVIGERAHKTETRLLLKEDSINQLGLEKKELEKIVEENKVLFKIKEQSIENLQLEKDKLLAVVEKIAEENKVLQNLIEQCNENFQLEKNELVAEVKKIAEEGKVLVKLKEETINKLEEEKQDLEKIVEENEALFKLKEQSIKDLKKEKNILLTDLEKIAKEKEVLEELNESNAATGQSYLHRMSVLQSTSDMYKNQAEKNRKAYEGMLSKYEQLQNYRKVRPCFRESQETIYLREKIKDYQAMFDAAELSKHLAIEELKKFKTEISRLKPDHNLVVEKYALELKLNDEREINNQITKNLEEMTREKTVMEEVLKNMSEQSEIMQSQIKDLEVLVSKLDQEKLERDETIEMMKDKVNDLNTRCALWEEEVFDCKSYCGDLKQAVAKEEEASLKLKEEIIKKDAVIEYLSKEKDQFLKKQASLNEDLNDMGARLKMAADLYREQYLKIIALNKIIKSKSKVRHGNSIDGATEEHASASCSSSQISDRPSCSASSTASQNSDSDTGEHFQRATEKVAKVMREALIQNAEDTLVRKSLSRSLERNAPDVVPDQSDKLHHALARDPSGSFRKAEGPKEEALHQMIEQNLANLSASSPVPKCGDDEAVSKEYSLPCCVCECIFEVSSHNTDAMIKHLETVHQQQMCPICGCLFDMNMPEKYFQFHIDDHYNEIEGKSA